MNVGVIGLGIMGRPMVKRLLEAGHVVHVNDISEEAMLQVEGYGAVPCISLKELVEQSAIIFTMLPNSSHVEEVALGENSIIVHGRAGQILIDTSSISPVISKKIADSLAEKGIGMMDAPVSGGETGAIEGTLSIMAGGEEATFNKVLPLLKAVGRDIIHVGGHGAGSLTKLANQIMVNVNMAAMAEAIVFARKAGIDITKMYEAVRGGAAGSAVLDAKIKSIVHGDYTAGGPVSINAKDLTNVLEAGRELGAALPLTAQVLEMFGSLLSHGHGRTDHSGLVLHYEMLANLDTAT